jgi:two-component system cell cycle response regulator
MADSIRLRAMTSPAPLDLTPPDPISVLLRLTEALTSAASLEIALGAVTEAAIQLLPADHASVRLLDATHTTLLASARAGRGTSHPQVALRSGEGIAGWALETGQPVRVDDVRLDARFKPASGQGFAIRSMVAAPLCASGKVVGVLSASSPEAGAFAARDERLAQLLANCSVPPLERARLERLAMTDELTLAFNARYLRSQLARALEEGRDEPGPSLLLIDLDDFKQVNDTLGHAAGDAVLRGFADRVRATVRQLDALVRRGGDEFALVMPATTREQARSVAERLRRILAEEPFDVGGARVVQTVSIGVATWDGSESPESLEARADRALYAGKSRGRNVVDVAEDDVRRGGEAIAI